MLSNEPPIAADDTKPRAPIAERPNRPAIKRRVPDTVYDNYPDYDEKKGGCANSLLLFALLGGAFAMFAAIVGLAGLAGYRDGVNDKAAYTARTSVAIVSTQRAGIAQDRQNGNWELVLSRCQYLQTLTPGDTGMQACISEASTALAVPATPLPTDAPANANTIQPTTAVQAPQATLAPNIITATPAPVANPLDKLLAQAKAQIEFGKTENLENARELLEAIRSQDKTYQQRTVEPQLCQVYENLGSTYNAERRLSEMVIVINNGLLMQCKFERKDWAFTVDAATLYLSAKGYADAGNLTQAIRVYRTMAQRGQLLYQNAKELACNAFRAGNDAAAVSAYCS
jgi:hypothetical protein